jgi:predicted signal transduction protein with EAL and GGDEF domain
VSDLSDIGNFGTRAGPDTGATGEPHGISHEALMQFLYQAPIGLVQTDAAGEIVLMNPMAAQLLLPLAPHGQLVNLFEVLAGVAPQLRGQAAASRTGDVVCDALRVAVQSPERADSVLSIRLLRLDADALMCSVSDATAVVLKEEQRLNSQLRDAGRIDPLTQLPNRLAICERITQALQRARLEPSRHFAVLFVNGDRYNRVNVTHGQAVGDELLRLTATRLNSTVREHDAVGLGSAAGTAANAAPEQTAARLGNDEFVVVLDGLRSPDDAEPIAQRLVDALARPYRVNDHTLHLSCTVGVVVFDPLQPAADADSMLQDAHLAMREAKRSGGARCCRFDPEMKTRAQRRGGLENDLRGALREHELFVVYQPIVRLNAQGLEGRAAVAGFEALVRWRHPQRGLLPPIEFIEIAEETGLIGELGAFVLDTACRQFVAWRAQLGATAPATLSVNLSRAQLLDAGITDSVRQALQRSGLPASQLQLEVTESLAAQDAVVRQRLLELKGLGLTLALDDFGTGYSSLSSLHLLPIDVVKIDRSFVSQAEASAHHRVLIEATVRVAQSLGMRTVAEGIETAGQAAILGRLHCDKGQGYLIAKPMTADDATLWLKACA